jgi:preprotein translocase subunit SecE
VIFPFTFAGCGREHVEMSREDKRRSEREERRIDAHQNETHYESSDGKRTPPKQFLREVRTELRKVNWPSRKELVTYTIVVLVVTTVLVGIVWAMDWGIREAILRTLG